jgi:hypothetical protein
MRKGTIFVATAAVAALASPMAASAAPGQSTAPKLVAFNCVSDGAIYGPCNTTQPGSSGWVKNDAPGNTDGYSLALTTAANTPGAVSYAGANVLNTPVNGARLGLVAALSFQTNGYQGGGAPRISLMLSNGGIAYLDPEYCQSAADPNGWRLADFREPSYTGGADPTNCTIYTNFGTFTTGPWQPGYGPQISGDYTAFDWMNWAASNGSSSNEPTVNQIILVQDSGPGTSYIDDLTLGTGPQTQPTAADHSVTFTAPPGRAGYVIS